MAKELRFRSAVGWSFKIPVLTVATALILSQWRGINVVGLGALSLALAVMGWLYVSTVYTVTDRGLLVRSGPVRRWADAKLIDRVRPTRTMISAPALSLDRLEVAGRFGAVVVSPIDRAGFVRALERVAPQMRLEGNLQTLDTG